MIPPEIEAALRAAGIEPERVETPDGEVYVVSKLAPAIELRGLRTRSAAKTGRFVIGAAAAARHVGAIVASGVVSLAGTSVDVHRCAEPAPLRGLGRRIPEGPGNLARRAEWFQKRRG